MSNELIEQKHAMCDIFIVFEAIICISDRCSSEMKYVLLVMPIVDREACSNNQGLGWTVWTIPRYCFKDRD